MKDMLNLIVIQETQRIRIEEERKDEVIQNQRR